MGWFLCSDCSVRSAQSKGIVARDRQIQSGSDKLKVKPSLYVKEEGSNDGRVGGAHMFTFHELAAAAKNFWADYLLGEGGFGRVYKGQLETTNQVVAIKQLDRNGLQGNR
ncbi:hypothetical protein MLD38_009790 [Melastoma candidum]|uniref:Uncharacterized protein n=1 Tax=Melastoma candidum TaxID=119954 RepID=A0ACB9S311_9MYRT|nr:hypothetical protein MLD38_009790 [Melastoma candidum]